MTITTINKPPTPAPAAIAATLPDLGGGFADPFEDSLPLVELALVAALELVGPFVFELVGPLEFEFEFELVVTALAVSALVDVPGPVGVPTTHVLPTQFEFEAHTPH
jgi:hypothetical protein